MTLGITSCEELSGLFSLLETLTDPTGLNLSEHSLDMIVGDSLELSVEFLPDSATKYSVSWQIEEPRIAQMKQNTIFAISEGNTKLAATAYAGWLNDTTLNVISDTCTVRVFDVALDKSHFRYDMVIYVQIQINGRDVTADADLKAFVNDEVRGIGRHGVANGTQYIELRVYSNQQSGETVYFKCHIPTVVYSIVLDQAATFDGESHGSLTSPYLLTGSTITSTQQ